LGGQSLSSSIRIPCLLSFLGSQIFVFLIKDSLSLEVLGWPDFVYSLSFEVIGWVGQLHCCASHMAPTQLPRCHRLSALLPVTAQCLQHKFQNISILLVCVYLSLYNFLCDEVTVVTRILSSIVICKCISLATDPPPLVPHNCHFILFLAAFYTREIFQLIDNEIIYSFLL
jgi:hypothetical protein